MGKKIVFLDRDGVINKKAPTIQDLNKRYVTDIDSFAFNPGIVVFLKRLAAQGFEFIVITNQRGVARGVMTEEDLTRIHDHMRDTLKHEGVELLDIFYCPHEEGACGCRKPLPGMLKAATEKYDIDLAASFLISDSGNDVAMGMAFGIGKNILVPEDDLSALMNGGLM